MAPYQNHTFGKAENTKLIILFLYKSNIFFKTYYPNFIWDIPTEQPTIYLTFDDGPVPTATNFVLDTLSKYNAKATFFCIGQNIKENPEIFNQILANGHSVGNHTMNHLNGWDTENECYIEDFIVCQGQIGAVNLFRPPYGKIKKSQAKIIQKTHRIIMWDVISYDFSPKMNPEKCLQKCLELTKANSIIVFHDSEKALKNMSYVLPRFLAYFKEKGFHFKPIIF